jgi:hypothetical protein
VKLKYQGVNMKKITAKLGLISAALGFCLSLMVATPLVSAQAAGATSNNFEMAYVDQSGNAFVKSGGIGAPYLQVWTSSNPATAVEVSHNAIAVLDQNGNLYVNSLPKLAGWTLVANGITTRNFGISDKYLVLFLNNTLYEKPISALTSGWTPFLTGTQGFQIADNGNIAAETLNGTLYEAYGGYGAQWTPVATGFGSYDVSDNEVAAVFGNQLYVMIGAPVSNSWRLTYQNASRVQLSPDGNIGVTDPQGYLDVALGGYGSRWVNQESNSSYTYVSDGYVTTVNGGALFAPLGGPGSDTWTEIAGSVTSYSIAD